MWFYSTHWKLLNDLILFYSNLLIKFLWNNNIFKLFYQNDKCKSGQAILLHDKIRTEGDNTTDLHRKNMENLRKLNFCKNRRKDVVQQKINEDSILKCYEVLRECNILSWFGCGS